MKMKVAVFLLLLLIANVATANVFLEEKFNDDEWTSRWVVSDWKKEKGEAGEWKHTAGKYHMDPNDKGIQTTPDARFYAISAKLSEEFDNTGKDLVLQFQVKHEQKIDCGGGYVKLLEGNIDQKTFGGDTPYSIMFGPDICGYSTKRVHAILTHGGVNMLIKKTVDCETDELSHVYTFILSPNNTYKILIDGNEKSSGSIFDEWDFLKPRKINDPDAKKPSDWVDEEFIDDPEDKKPEGWDDIPAEIVDPEAKKPDDWDDADDGEWEAPLIPNPEYKGEWKPKRVKNPEYKGKWFPPQIDNPEFVEKPEAYKLPPLTHLGIELWQVKSGTIFDNILVTDDAEYASKFLEETWGKLSEVEKEKFDEEEKKREAEEEEERKKAETEMENDDDDEEPEDIPEDEELDSDDVEGEDIESETEKGHDEL